MRNDNKHMTQDGFRPLTEGYQPGSQILQKGFVPVSTGATPAKPPSGGSSVAKPAQASATSTSSKG